MQRSIEGEQVSWLWSPVLVACASQKPRDAVMDHSTYEVPRENAPPLVLSHSGGELGGTPALQHEPNHARTSSRMRGYLPISLLCIGRWWGSSIKFVGERSTYYSQNKKNLCGHPKC